MSFSVEPERSDVLMRVEDLQTHLRTDDGVVKAVDGVSFSLKAGQTLAIVGESGSGKSILGLSLLGLLPPPAFHPAGKIWFQGQDLMTLSSGARRQLRGRDIAMIFQDPMTSLNPYLRVERQLTEVAELHQGVSREEARDQAKACLEEVGIDDADIRLRSYPHELSGGLRQRVMVAMALLCKPALIIADEPTTALDVTVQAQILRLLKQLQEKHGTSIVLVTHDLGVVGQVADQVAVMYGGALWKRQHQNHCYLPPAILIRKACWPVCRDCPVHGSGN